MKSETSSNSEDLSRGGGMLVCCVCKHAFVSKEWKKIEAAGRANDQSWHCLACGSLEMARRAAHARGISLRKAARIFCEATAVREEATFDAVWKGNASAEVPTSGDS